MSAKRGMPRCYGEEYDRDECAGCVWRRECMVDNLKRKLERAIAVDPLGKLKGRK